MVKTEPPACRVMMQYFSGDGLVCELESGGVELDVRVSSQATSPNMADWLVAAHNGRGVGSVVVAESAPTRTEALSKVGRAWAEKAAELGLPTFDWDAVAAALSSVRAI